MKALRETVRGLYAITDPNLMPPPLFAAKAEAALRGGARVLQYRDKGKDHARREAEARLLAALCHDHGALFVINDDVGLARAVNAPALHLGDEDMDIATARRLLGGDILIGASCYDRLDLAEAALAGGADYVAFGAFHPSPTKPDTVRAPVSLLAEARRAFAAPIVAIGGITAENGAALIAAGADALAVVSAVFAPPTPEGVEVSARRLAALWHGG